MPKCTECKYEGPYTEPGPRSTLIIMTADGQQKEVQNKFMRCQHPSGGPVDSAISLRESLSEFPCEYYQPRPQPKAETGFFAKLWTNMKIKRQVKKVGVSYNHPHTYEVYRAPSKEAALAFLNTKKVTKKLYYIVVETPEGNWGLDITGIYQEK